MTIDGYLELLCLPHHLEAFLGLPLYFGGVPTTLGLQATTQMPPPVLALSPYVPSPRHMIFPSPSPLSSPIKYILFLSHREIPVSPSSNPPSYLIFSEFVDSSLFIIYLTVITDLVVSTYHICLSGSGSPHSG